ncbi:putative short-chain dehydrogenases/reductase [Xylariaceae sp. FL1019]|nr:putative short-chain dehydrogenases/reductase [Xylariaceae sp. FL1019]
MMVSLTDVVASNQRIASTLPRGLVAVFVGGTSGVGEYTLKAFTRYADQPRVYIVGRSQESADRIIDECRALSPKGHFEFLKADVSSLKNVDAACCEIKKKESSINILFQSQGNMAWTEKSPDGLPMAFAVAGHSRLRFALNLLPLLEKAGSLRRVVSVACATCEGPIDLSNIPGEGFQRRQWRDQLASVSTLWLEELQRRAPTVAFVHTVPGVVDSGIMRDLKPDFQTSIIVGVFRLLKPFINTPPAESGERHTFAATSAMFAPVEGGKEHAGVPLNSTIGPGAQGTNGQLGSGIYSIGMKNEATTLKTVETLRQFHQDGTADKVWEYFMSDFKRIIGTECMT